MKIEKRVTVSYHVAGEAFDTEEEAQGYTTAYTQILFALEEQFPDWSGLDLHVAAVLIASRFDVKLRK